MNSGLTRRRLESTSKESLHIARNSTKADVHRFEWPHQSGEFAVLKDMRARPLWYRVLAGRFFLRREYNALRALHSVEGVPRALARPDSDCIVMQWSAGTPLVKWEDGSVSPQALEKIAQIIAQAHSRGVIHGDMHRSNVLLTPEGEVTIIDWATAGIFGRRRGLKKWTFEEWSALDVRAVAKLKARHAPQTLSEAEKAALQGGSKLYRLVRGTGFQIRRILGNRKAKSPTQAASDSQKLAERETSKK